MQHPPNWRRDSSGMSFQLSARPSWFQQRVPQHCPFASRIQVGVGRHLAVRKRQNLVDAIDKLLVGVFDDREIEVTALVNIAACEGAISYLALNFQQVTGLDAAIKASCARRRRSLCGQRCRGCPVHRTW